MRHGTLTPMPPTAWTDDQRNQALAVYVTDGPAAAAAATGIPRGTIASWAHRAGVHSVATEKLTTALELQHLTLAARRAELAERLYAEAGALLDQLWTPATVHSFDKDGGFHTGELDEPTFRDKQAIVTSAAILVDKAQLLSGEATERPDGSMMTTEERRARLTGLVDELETRRRERQAS